MVIIAAVIVGIIYIRHQRYIHFIKIIILLCLTYFFIRHAVVQALVKTEEGERRNYKIDFAAIEIQTLLGTGIIVTHKTQKVVTHTF